MKNLLKQNKLRKYRHCGLFFDVIKILIRFRTLFSFLLSFSFSITFQFSFFLTANNLIFYENFHYAFVVLLIVTQGLRNKKNTWYFSVN